MHLVLSRNGSCQWDDRFIYSSRSYFTRRNGVLAAIILSILSTLLATLLYVSFTWWTINWFDIRFHKHKVKTDCKNKHLPQVDQSFQMYSVIPCLFLPVLLIRHLYPLYLVVSNHFKYQFFSTIMIHKIRLSPSYFFSRCLGSLSMCLAGC